MIELRQVSKSFDSIKAVDGLDLSIEDGKVFGLLGTNGAGKSTLMRMISGIIRPDRGQILADGKEIAAEMELKREIFFIPDEDYYFANSCAAQVGEYYAYIYSNFDQARMNQLLQAFSLDPRRRIRTYSKGMKRQLSFIIGIAAKTRWLLCDETFDGLDPVMRQTVKSLLASEMCDRDFTPVIASHNLRELEDICDHVGLLHKGGVLLSRDLDDLKGDLHKFQMAASSSDDCIQQLRSRMDLLSCEKQGSLITLIARGESNDLAQQLHKMQPAFLEELPLNLEEIFIYETGVYGYDIKNLIM